MKLAKPKVEGTPTVGSILKKRGLYWVDSLVPIHHLPVPGGKLWMGTRETFLVYQNITFELVVPSKPWCDPWFETRGAIHCFLQHLLVRPMVFYNTSNSIKTRLIKWKQRPGIQSWISKLCFLISRKYWMEAASTSLAISTSPASQEKSSASQVSTWARPVSTWGHPDTKPLLQLLLEALSLEAIQGCPSPYCTCRARLCHGVNHKKAICC